MALANVHKGKTGGVENGGYVHSVCHIMLTQVHIQPRVKVSKKTKNKKTKKEEKPTPQNTIVIKIVRNVKK